MVFAALCFFAQSPLGFFCSIAARALSLRSRSSREGFSFLLPEQKKRNKENSPSALFCLLRHFSPLNKKNSLRSNSFLFFTLRKAPSLHGKKVRPDLCAFFMQHRFARWGGCFLSSLRSLGCDVFFFSLRSFILSSRSYLYQKIKRDFRRA